MEFADEIEIGRWAGIFFWASDRPKRKSRSRRRWLDSLSAVTRRDPDFVRF
jgi:hypothetical protein